MPRDTTPKYQALSEQSDKLGHANTCAVIALAVVTDSSYEDAYAALQLACEPESYDATGKRAYPWPKEWYVDDCWSAILRAARILDKRASFVKEVEQLTLRQFENAQHEGRWLLGTREHAVGYADGQIHDYSRKHGRRRIQQAWRII